MTTFRSTARQIAVAAKALALFTLLLGIAYPLLAFHIILGHILHSDR